MNYERTDLRDRTKEFAIRVVRLYSILPRVLTASPLLLLDIDNIPLYGIW